MQNKELIKEIETRINNLIHAYYSNVLLFIERELDKDKCSSNIKALVTIEAGSIIEMVKSNTINNDEFTKEAKQVREDFVGIIKDYDVAEHNELRTEADSLLIMYDQAIENNHV